MFALLFVLFASLNAHAAPNLQQVIQYIQQLEERIEVLEAENDELRSVMTINGDEVTFEGVNVRITNGTGLNSDLNGAGNLIIGYNNVPLSDRTGSHNLVLGWQNAYRSYSTIVNGTYNQANGSYVVAFGHRNTVAGNFSSVLGGSWNHTTDQGYYSTIVGGESNTTFDDGGTVLGGFHNNAVGEYSTVSGGSWNTADGFRSHVSGGTMNIATGEASSVLGGEENFAHGDWSTVTGGLSQVANGDYEVR